MTYDGICDNYKKTKPQKGERCENGQKRCQACNIFMCHDGLCCTCCNMQLRDSSQYVKMKEKVITLVQL